VYETAENAVSATGAIIVAGGKSRRMGQDKALLKCGGMTLLERCIASLQPHVRQIVVVADVPDKYALPSGCVLGDAFPDCGPVGGIVTGLGALGTGSHLVLACDMPLVQPGVIRLLRDAATEEWDAAVPEIDGEWEPLCAVYRHAAAPKLRRFLESGGRSARKAIDELTVRRIGEDELRRADPHLISFTNINTPEEWTNALPRLAAK
jgi:molybdopterin-guanine dinucleotide biosynthesis protein A